MKGEKKLWRLATAQEIVDLSIADLLKGNAVNFEAAVVQEDADGKIDMIIAICYHREVAREIIALHEKA